jgi:hypothetical protein
MKGLRMCHLGGKCRPVLDSRGGSSVSCASCAPHGKTCGTANHREAACPSEFAAQDAAARREWNAMWAKPKRRTKR